MIADEVRSHLQTLGSLVRPGASPADFEEFERRTGVRPPRTVVDFYRAFDGTTSTIVDPLVAEPWPLKEMGRITEVVTGFRGIPDYGPLTETLSDAQSYVGFADGMVWSYVLAFKDVGNEEETGPVIWLCGGAHTLVADSFSQFWKQYLNDPERVLAPDV